MPTTLIVGTNTYVTLAEAEAWAGNRLMMDAWNNATDAQQEAALLMACQAIERLDPAGWDGTPTTTTQKLQWPRFGVTDRTKTTYNYAPGYGYGYYFDSNIMPQPLKDAQYEEALELLKQSGDPGHQGAMRDQAKGITGLSVYRSSISYGVVVRFGGTLYSKDAFNLCCDLRRTRPVRMRP